ncbi:putative 4-carboxymuconolactone decarboxylase [Paraburkholderia tropica]|uniref:carboxymuconolactone decarboxylase family protein n=1 Tax=Paraburkholderia tropica TaxID=92647 RepID=UPI001CB1E62A|nr:carboxymuconolactone decarboxylase family protein [Paraburkholderia tropica]CAG9201947.1 putative 4-carboxymuconolactone decarboxylase [Paraburkholderia tropica]
MTHEDHSTPRVDFAQVAAVSPALAEYTRKHVIDDLWSRPGLSKRDRSLVTVAALVARGQEVGYGHYIDGALDNGVTPSELSELLLQLAFYAGWPNALSAIQAAHESLVKRGIDSSGLPQR